MAHYDVHWTLRVRMKKVFRIFSPLTFNSLHFFLSLFSKALYEEKLQTKTSLLILPRLLFHFYIQGLLNRFPFVHLQYLYFFPLQMWWQYKI